MTRTVNMPVVDYSDITLPIENGGTAAHTVQGAVANLSILTNAMRGMPGGPVSLDASGRISAALVASSVGGNVVNIEGSLTAVVSSSSVFTITDFDSFKTYAVSVSAGTVSRSGAEITVNTPATAQTVTLIVNGRSFNIVVSAPQVDVPTLTGVDTGAGSAVTITYTASAFSMPLSADTHLNSDWQVATDADFTTIVAQSLADAVNRTVRAFTGLAVNTTYHARVRYRSSANTVSEWSATQTITTRVSYAPSIEEAKIVASDRGFNNLMGRSVSITADGNRVAVGAIGNEEWRGATYIYVRSGSTWTQEAKLIASDRNFDDNFGSSVAITADGSRVAVGAANDDWIDVEYFTEPGPGAVYVYVRSGTTWTQEAKLIASDRTENSRLGYSVSVTNDGTRIISGAPGANASGSSLAGAAYIFLRSGTTWSQQGKLVANDVEMDSLLGTSVCISDDGARAVVGSAMADNPGNVNSGAVYIFTRSANIWTQEAKIFASDAFNSDNFGHSVSLTGDSSRVVIGAYSARVGGVFQAGAAYVFLRTGTTWAQEAKLSASDFGNTDRFGFSVSITSDGTQVAVGSYWANIGPVTDAGAVYIFGRSGSTWGQQIKLTSSDRANNDEFGYSVSITADGTRVAVGAVTSDVGGVGNTGSAYVFRS